MYKLKDKTYLTGFVLDTKWSGRPQMCSSQCLFWVICSLIP